VFFFATHDPFILAIAERVRLVISRQPGYRLDEVARTLNVPREDLGRLLDDSNQSIDIRLLIDTVVALVREAGIDPKWLLSGQYDGAMHRQALLLGEDRTLHGAQALRDFVQDEYKRLCYRDTWSIPRAIAQTAHRFFVRQGTEKPQ
jgi:hypothetical protein